MGTVPGHRDQTSHSPHTSLGHQTHHSLHRGEQGHQSSHRGHDQRGDHIKAWRESESLRRDQAEEALRRDQANFARQFQSQRGAMADPRHPMGLPPTSLPGTNIIKLLNILTQDFLGLSQHAASLQALAAHYPGVGGHGSIPQHLMPPAQALLQYQQLAAAASLGKNKNILNQECSS